ncbi:UNVERIFIED_CONTAM: hypothetical protein HDU68_001506 [Siphonaria sp. JEL0065]|nr:hypothetical protein HDU68_001506 [Siphonaria sp. JEL0065]
MSNSETLPVVVSAIGTVGVDKKPFTTPHNHQQQPTTYYTNASLQHYQNQFPETQANHQNPVFPAMQQILQQPSLQYAPIVPIAPPTYQENQQQNRFSYPTSPSPHLYFPTTPNNSSASSRTSTPHVQHYQQYQQFHQPGTHTRVEDRVQSLLLRDLPVLSPAEDIDQEKGQQSSKKRKCFPCLKTKKHWLICITVSLLVVVTVGVLAFFYIPRFPDIKVYSLDLSNVGTTNTAYSFTFTDPANRNLNQIRLQMNLTMHVGTFNPNLYDLKVDAITVVARLLVNTSIVYDALKTNALSSFGGLVSLVASTTGGNVTKFDPAYSGKNDSVIGTASTAQGQHLLFPPKEWTNYVLLFLLDYTPDPQLGLLHDPTILEIASACGITSRSAGNSTARSRLMKVRYTATSTIPALQAIGYSPLLSNDMWIGCPFGEDQISSVIERVQGGEDVFDAIQQVFGGSSLSGSSSEASSESPSTSSEQNVPTITETGDGNELSSSGEGVVTVEEIPTTTSSIHTTTSISATAVSPSSLLPIITRSMSI